MALGKNQTYIARRTFATRDADDIPVTFERGGEYKTDSDRRLVDVVTGEVFNIKNHVSDMSEWYFDEKGSFNPFRDKVSQFTYVVAILRRADGFDLDELYATAEAEAFGPLEKSFSRSTFSQCLTNAVATGRFEMRKDGEVVQGIGHNKRDCTFHIVRKKVA